MVWVASGRTSHRWRGTGGGGRTVKNNFSESISLDSDTGHRSHGCLNTADSDMPPLEDVLCMTPLSGPIIPLVSSSRHPPPPPGPLSSCFSCVVAMHIAISALLPQHPLFVQQVCPITGMDLAHLLTAGPFFLHMCRDQFRVLRLGVGHWHYRLAHRGLLSRRPIPESIPANWLEVAATEDACFALV